MRDLVTESGDWRVSRKERPRVSNVSETSRKDGRVPQSLIVKKDTGDNSY